jgi:hypothetical protein
MQAGRRAQRRLPRGGGCNRGNPTFPSINPDAPLWSLLALLPLYSPGIPPCSRHRPRRVPALVPAMLPPSSPPFLPGLGTTPTVGNPLGRILGPPATDRHPSAGSFATYSLPPPHPFLAMGLCSASGIVDTIANRFAGSDGRKRSQFATAGSLFGERKFDPLVCFSLFLLFIHTILTTSLF